MRSITICVLAILGVSPVLAADQQKAERLLEVTHVEQSVQQMRAIMLSGVEDGYMKKCLGSARPAERCQKEVAQVLAPMDRALTEAFKWDDLKPEFVAIYAKELTDAEMDAAVAFYSTPEGQSLLNKMPQLMQEGAKVGQQRMQAIAPRLQAESEEVIKKLEAEDDAAKAAPEKK